MLQGFHAVIAWQTEHPHWLLNDPDAKIYGTALSNALRHFPIAATQKAIDIGSLVIAAFNFDGIRLATELRIRREARLRARPQPRGPAQVFQFVPGGTPQAPPQTPPPDPPPAWSPDMTYEPELPGAAD